MINYYGTNSTDYTQMISFPVVFSSPGVVNCCRCSTYNALVVKVMFTHVSVTGFAD